MLRTYVRQVNSMLMATKTTNLSKLETLRLFWVLPYNKADISHLAQMLNIVNTSIRKEI